MSTIATTSQAATSSPFKRLKSKRNEEKPMKTTLFRSYIMPCLFALLLVPFTALPGAAAARSGSPDLAKIDALITSQMQADRIPGVAVGLVHGSQVVHVRGFGVADATGRA